MGLLQDIFLEHSIGIRTTPEEIWNFFLNLETNYTTWHPQDHVIFRWLKGKPWEEGSVIYAEEILHGKVHKLKYVVTKVVPGREITFSPVSRLLRTYFPKNMLIIEQKGDICTFTATGHIRVGWLVRKLARKKLEFGLAEASRHMREEAENLKAILEAS
jgi:hypothetical protein